MFNVKSSSIRMNDVQMGDKREERIQLLRASTIGKVNADQAFKRELG